MTVLLGVVVAAILGLLATPAPASAATHPQHVHELSAVDSWSGVCASGHAGPQSCESMDTIAQGIHAYDPAVTSASLVPCSWRPTGDAAVLSVSGCDAAATRATASVADDLAVAESHLGSIDAMTGPNRMMLDRIAGAQQSGRALTTGEQNFLLHETTEARLVGQGLSQDAAHAGALETHPLFSNYDPEVIKAFPEYFNSNWRAFWGIE